MSRFQRTGKLTRAPMAEGSWSAIQRSAERLVERVLPEWSGAKNILHLVYPTPRGKLPSVRSLIDYLLIHVPAWLQERGI
jgi:hypothetical protein